MENLEFFDFKGHFLIIKRYIDVFLADLINFNFDLLKIGNFPKFVVFGLKTLDSLLKLRKLAEVCSQMQDFRFKIEETGF